MITTDEKRELRMLANQVSEISRNPIWEDKRSLWNKKNSLKKTRPMILCSIPETAWEEIIPNSSLIIQDPFFRKYELELRRKVYRWEHIKDDEIINGKVYVPISHTLTDWIEGRQRPYSNHADNAAAFTPCIHDYSDLKRLRFPELSIDRRATELNLAAAYDVFGGILEIVEGEPFYSSTDSEVMGWGNSLIDVLCELRGLEAIYYDLYLAPEFIHEAMDFLMRGTLRYLDEMEREKMLRLNNNEFIYATNTPLGSNGLACIEELPPKNYDPDHITTKDLWGYTQAQEFVVVSPENHAEFVLPYQQKIAERFGLNSYGCCEVNDKKWENIIAHIPNLREVSISHATDLEIAAEKLKNKYVLSWKPHPVKAIYNYNEENIRNELRNGFEIMKECHVIACLRDTQTLYGEPERAGGWTRIAQEVAEEY